MRVIPASSTVYAALLSAGLATAQTPPINHTQPVAKTHDVNPHAAALADFTARVDKYVTLRNKADDSAPPLKKTEDARKIQDAQQALAERIGAARKGSKQGDIFTPEITAEFRRLLRPEVKDPPTKAAIKEEKAAVSFKIGAPYPDKQPLATVPPNVLMNLPKLPKDIDYRFADKHLILRDSRANTIIDYIPNAIP